MEKGVGSGGGWGGVLFFCLATNVLAFSGGKLTYTGVFNSEGVRIFRGGRVRFKKKGFLKKLAGGIIFFFFLPIFFPQTKKKTIMDFLIWGGWGGRAPPFRGAKGFLALTRGLLGKNCWVPLLF